MDFINQIHNVHRTAVLILYFICSALNGIFYISKSNKHYKIEEETYAKMIDQMKEKFHADVDWENVDDFQTKSLREIYKVAHTYCLLAQKKWCILTNINTILNRKQMNPRNWPNIWHPILCLRMRATMNQCLRRYLICKIETILFVYWLCCNLTFFFYMLHISVNNQTSTPTIREDVFTKKYVTPLLSSFFKDTKQIKIFG